MAAGFLMEKMESQSKGYVYILEVKDIDLPVCKIGMTTRDPYDRCKEINNSSTGDFIWAVAHYISVDNCKKMESIIHSKIAPLRQKGREFFNINADDAYRAIISIVNSQSEVNVIEPEKSIILEERQSDVKRKRKARFDNIDTRYAELLQVFSSLLNIKGKPFGRVRTGFGMSDGAEGVQWNISVSPGAEMVRLGVNLEGMKYKDWPIASFILSEISKPEVEMLKNKVDKPDEVYISFFRDAWQYSTRRVIEEKYLGGSIVPLAEINPEKWRKILDEALCCLDKERQFRGRAKQTVTLLNKTQTISRVMEVSPHLQISSPVCMQGNIEKNLQYRFSQLQPIYQWIIAAARS